MPITRNERGEFVITREVRTTQTRIVPSTEKLQQELAIIDGNIARLTENRSRIVAEIAEIEALKADDEK